MKIINIHHKTYNINEVNGINHHKWIFKKSNLHNKCSFVNARKLNIQQKSQWQHMIKLHHINCESSTTSTHQTITNEEEDKNSKYS